MRKFLHGASLAFAAAALIVTGMLTQSHSASAVGHHSGRATIACTEKGYETTYPDMPHPHNKFELTPNPHSCGDLTRARIGCAYATGVPHVPDVTVYFNSSRDITKAGQVSRAYCKAQPSLVMKYADWSGWQLRYSGKWHTVCVWRYHLRCPKG